MSYLTVMAALGFESKQESGQTLKSLFLFWPLVHVQIVFGVKALWSNQSLASAGVVPALTVFNLIGLLISNPCMI